jgi:hypothetical protein
LHKATALGKQAVIECDPKQDITKTIAIHAGFSEIAEQAGVVIMRKSLTET